MRDLAMLLPLALLLFLAWRNAYAAFLLWGWAGIMAINTFMYGFMRGVSYVQWFALLALLAIFLRRDAGLARSFNAGAVGVVMIGFAVHTIVVALAAYPGLPRNAELAGNVIKILLFCLAMPLVVTSKLRMQVLVLVLAVALGTHGVIEGLKFVASGAAHQSQGNAKLGDRNHFALYIVMGLPLLVYLFMHLQARLARLLLAGVMLLGVLAVVATHSRGGLLALMGVGLWLVLRSRRKFAGLAVVLAGALLVYSVAPSHWFERMETISTAGEGASFQGRMQAWKRATAIAVEHPFVGGGFHSVQAGSIFMKYRDRQGLMGWLETERAAYPQAAHSIYFEVLGDMGFVGLFLFLAIMFSPFVIHMQVQQAARRVGREALWASDLTAMASVSMVAYLVGGAALSMAYTDLPYILAMISAVTLQLLRQQHPAAFGLPQRPAGGPQRTAYG